MLAANCTKLVFSNRHLYGTIYGFNILPLASTFVSLVLTGVSVETFLNQFRHTQQPQERSNICYTTMKSFSYISPTF